MHGRAACASLIVTAFLLAGLASAGHAAAAPTLTAQAVPPSYADLYAALSSRLASFETTVATRWNGTRSNVAFSAELLTANANRGTALLNASAYSGVQLELSRYAAMGLKAVTVSLGFPILDPAFFANVSEYQGFLAFYKRLAADVHADGMKLVIDAAVLFPTYADLPVAAYYANLTYAEYIQRRVAMTVLTARELAPDWLAFGEEPDTEQSITGQPVNSPTAYTAFANAVTANVTAAGLTVPIGAGVGTWHPAWRGFAAAYAANTSLAFVDVHVYPVNYDLLTRLWDIADLVHAGGKAVGIGEAWLYKARDSELSSGVYFDSIFQRDAYDFWAPLDGRFLADLVNYSHAESLAFLSPYWSKFLHAYLSYATAASMTYAQETQASNYAAYQAMLAGRLSPSGTTYVAAINGFPPAEPPRGLFVLLLILGVAAVVAVVGIVLWMRRPRNAPPPPPPGVP